MSAPELLRLTQDCALEPQDECIAASLCFVRDVFQSVFLDSFHVNVLICQRTPDNEGNGDIDDGYHAVGVGGCASLREACGKAQTMIEALIEKGKYDATQPATFRAFVWCELHLKGTYFTGDPHDFFRRYDALSGVGKFSRSQEYRFYCHYSGVEDVSMSLFEQPSAGLYCRLEESHDVGLLLQQVRPVLERHVQFRVAGEIRGMLSRIFV